LRLGEGSVGAPETVGGLGYSFTKPVSGAPGNGGGARKVGQPWKKIIHSNGDRMWPCRYLIQDKLGPEYTKRKEMLDHRAVRTRPKGRKKALESSAAPQDREKLQTGALFSARGVSNLRRKTRKDYCVKPGG